VSWYPHAVTVAPASEPITLALAKQQCRVEDTTEDDLIGGYVAAARAHAEAYCNTPLVSRTITAKCDDFCDFAAFPLGPLASVISVSYVDTDGANQTLATSVYEVRSDGLDVSLVLKYNQVWPSIRYGSRITVTAVAGYTDVPDDIIHAILLLVAHWYQNREAVGDGVSILPMGVDALLCNHRRGPI
jgi:uncharacterized phiE125 gp8 family phage protein